MKYIFNEGNRIGKIYIHICVCIEEGRPVSLFGIIRKIYICIIYIIKYNIEVKVDALVSCGRSVSTEENSITL